MNKERKKENNGRTEQREERTNGRKKVRNKGNGKN